MSHRRRQNNLTLPIAQLAALAALGFVISPHFRIVTVVCFILFSGTVLGLALSRTNNHPSERRNPPDARMDRFANPHEPAGEPDGSHPLSTRELISRLRSIDWFQFEKLVATTYEHLGFSVQRSGGANPDGGIDLLVERDGEKTAVQCKHWKTRCVRVRVVREFLGALTDSGLKKGVIVTLCGYTGEAKRLADRHGIEISSGTDLVRMLEETNATSSPEVLSALDDTRKFCPKCASAMVLRTATKGLGAGKPFWGCSTFPRCWFTMPAA